MTLARSVVGAVAGHDAQEAWGRWEKAADRYWHRSSSTLGLLVVAQLLGWDFVHQVIAAAVGLVFGGGRFSPDVDLYRTWSRLERWIPDRWAGSPLRHHGISHSPWLALLLAGAAAVWSPIWGLWLVPAAWFCHDMGDVLVGFRPHGCDGPGPPWVLWWHNRGLGMFKSGGTACRWFTVACWLMIGWLLWVHL